MASVPSSTMRVKLLKIKDKLAKKGRRKDSVVDGVSRSNTDASELSTTPSLLGLPPEVRNDIYEYLAESTTLMLMPSSPKKRPPPVGLLLACKQTRQEYRAILLTRATMVIPVHSYNFAVIIRTFEKLPPEDVALMRMNESLWIYLQLAHVPSRDDRKQLRAWCDYRVETGGKSYFPGTGQRIPRDIVFQYSVKFLTHIMRPPRPASRYANGLEMKLDLLRSHVRMSKRLQTADEEPNFELIKLREDLDDCVRFLVEVMEDRMEENRSEA